VRAQLLRAQNRAPEAEEALGTAGVILDDLGEDNHPMLLTLEDLRGDR
jgi:hypothetical protein